MNSYEYDCQRFEKRLKYWREIGYTIKYTQLRDRLKVEFYNHHEKIPCYVEYLDDKIICYGDYSSFVFNYVYCDKDPRKVNYDSLHYMLGKIDKNINANEFNYDIAVDSLEKFYDDYLKEQIEQNDLDISKSEFKQNLTTYYDDYSMARAIDEFLEENNLEVMDLFECYPTGECYSEHAIAQIVIMKLIADGYDKRVNE